MLNRTDPLFFSYFFRCMTSTLFSSPTKIANGFVWRERFLRWAKTVFFLFSMLASLVVVCAPPLLIVLLDVLLPIALSSAAVSASHPSVSAMAITSQFRRYRFRSSVIDVPLVSIARSLLILCVYLVCAGRGPYLGITTLCCMGSIGFISIKAATMYGADTEREQYLHAVKSKDVGVIEALFVASLSLAMAHVVVAYKTTCRARRKLHIFKIDMEAVATYNKNFPTYSAKIALSN